MPFVGDSYLVRGTGPNIWTLQEPLLYEGRQDTFTVPSGFCTDFATVPNWFTWLIPRTGVYSRVAILHDYLIATKDTNGVNSADRDGIFRRMLREYGVSWPRRWMMWTAVRCWSGMRHASVKEWAQFLGIGLLAVLFLLIPTAVVGVWSIVFWFAEKLSGWLVRE